MSKWIIVDVDTQLRLGRNGDEMVEVIQLLKLGERNKTKRVVEYDAEKMFADTNLRIAEILTRDPTMTEGRACMIAMDEEAEMLGNLPIERCISNEVVIE